MRVKECWRCYTATRWSVTPRDLTHHVRLFPISDVTSRHVTPVSVAITTHVVSICNTLTVISGLNNTIMSNDFSKSNCMCVFYIAVQKTIASAFKIPRLGLYQRTLQSYSHIQAYKVTAIGY